MPRYLAITAMSFLVAATLVIAQGPEYTTEQLKQQLIVGDWVKPCAEGDSIHGIVPILRFTSADDVAPEIVNRRGRYAEMDYLPAIASSP